MDLKLDDKGELLHALLQLEVKLKAISHLMILAGKAAEEEVTHNVGVTNRGLGELLAEMGDIAGEVRGRLDEIFLGKVSLKLDPQ